MTEEGMSEIVSFPPGQARDLLERGDMEIVTSAEHMASENEKYARELFKEDFLGKSEIQEMNRKCLEANVGIEFDIPDIEFPYDKQALKHLSEEQSYGRERMCVLRPSHAYVTGSDGVKTFQKVTLKLLHNTFYYVNPFQREGAGKERIFLTPLTDNVISDYGLTAGYKFVTKDIIPGSLGKSKQEQLQLLQPGETNRSAVEAEWDLLMAYAVTGKRLLPDCYDATSTVVHSAIKWNTLVGGFKTDGIYLYLSNEPLNRSHIGICGCL